MPRPYIFEVSTIGGIKIKTNVTLHDFRDAFASFNRDNFSYAGLEALFNYIEEIDDSCGTEMELDVIGLCCEFAEYKNLIEFQQDYGSENYNTFDDISDQTMLITIDDESFIIQQF